MSKKYEELTFADNFMFTRILYHNPDLCKGILEMILGKRIHHLKQAAVEKTIDVRFDAKSVRFDVYTEDDEGSVYDVEMQVVLLGNLPKRGRYYHSMIDLDLIGRGEDYETLRNAYVIFICKNGLGKGYSKPIYIYENYCIDAEESPRKLNDGNYTVFVNAACDQTGLSEELKDFLSYVRTGNLVGTTPLLMKLDSEVQTAIAHKQWRMDYMTLDDMLKEERREGREEGIEQGREEGLEKGLFSLVSSLRSFLPDAEKIWRNVIAQPLYKDVSLEKIEKLYNEASL